MKQLFITILTMLCMVAGTLSAQPTCQEIMAAMELANDYFIQKYPDAGAPTFVKKERPSNLWTRGVYFEGLYALAELERSLGGEKADTLEHYVV